MSVNRRSNVHRAFARFKSRGMFRSVARALRSFPRLVRFILLHLCKVALLAALPTAGPSDIPSSGTICENKTRATIGRKAFRCWRKCPVNYACAAKRYMYLAMFPPRLPNRGFPCISCTPSLATQLPHTCHTFATHMPHICHMRFLV